LAEAVISKENKNPECLRHTHKTIKKVTEDLENLKYNTSIAFIMEYLNYLEDANRNKGTINKEVIEILAKLLAPFTPYLAEEIWSSCAKASADKEKYKKSIFLERWPEYDPKLVKDDEINLVIQINGKTRGTVLVPAEISEAEAKQKALES
jgi:leucyl-tRNA synthetase